MPAERRLCGARTHSLDHHPCGQIASKHLARCWLHGSATPNSIKKAARIEALSVVTRGELIPADVQPVQVLKDLLAEAIEYKTYFAERMAVLRELRYESAAGFEQVRGEWTFYSAAFDKAAKLATVLSTMKLDELAAKISLAQVRQIYASYLAALKSLPWVTEEQEGQLRQAFADQLRLRMAVQDQDKLEV